MGRYDEVAEDLGSLLPQLREQALRLAGGDPRRIKVQSRVRYEITPPLDGREDDLVHMLREGRPASRRPPTSGTPR